MDQIGVKHTNCISIVISSNEYNIIILKSGRGRLSEPTYKLQKSYLQDCHSYNMFPSSYIFGGN